MYPAHCSLPSQWHRSQSARSRAASQARLNIDDRHLTLRLRSERSTIGASLKIYYVLGPDEHGPVVNHRRRRCFLGQVRQGVSDHGFEAVLAILGANEFAGEGCSRRSQSPDDSKHDDALRGDAWIKRKLCLCFRRSLHSPNGVFHILARNAPVEEDLFAQLFT